MAHLPVLLPSTEKQKPRSGTRMKKATIVTEGEESTTLGATSSNGGHANMMAEEGERHGKEGKRRQ